MEKLKLEGYIQWVASAGKLDKFKFLSGGCCARFFPFYFVDFDLFGHAKELEPSDRQGFEFYWLYYGWRGMLDTSLWV